MKKIKLADVLWEAANRWLRANPNDNDDRECYSCPAVATAAGGHPFMPNTIRTFLTELGCDTFSSELLHREWKPTAESQGVRYMWLLLAMHIAEDEGIEIEVER